MKSLRRRGSNHRCWLFASGDENHHCDAEGELVVVEVVQEARREIAREQDSYSVRQPCAAAGSGPCASCAAWLERWLTCWLTCAAQSPKGSARDAQVVRHRNHRFSLANAAASTINE